MKNLKMQYNKMEIVSWNTRGLGSDIRRRIVRKFLTKNYKNVDIIALQELKITHKKKLERNLRALLPEGRIIIDYTNSGRGGCALLVNARLRVLETGTSGFGGAAWANIHTATGTVKVASIHAPNIREERTTYWDWWDRQLDGEDCIVVGDFNNVELPDDSRGKSALIRGAEERSWKRFTYRADLVDAYLAAAKTTGGTFTRMAFCGQRYDQARLDRFYLSNGGEWCESIQAVNHHSEQTLSDHIPVSLQLQLVHDDSHNWQPKSYFKMSTHLIKRPGVLEKLEEAWGQHSPFCRSTQKPWDLGWGRLRQILREEKAIVEKEEHGYQDLRREVEELRIWMEEEGGNSDLHAELQLKEAELREQDLREARAWKYRSKEKWLKEGEAPSRYFYAQLKAKFSREKIAVLEREDGRRIIGHQEILREIEEYYKQLYTRGEETEETRQARNRILQKLTKTISTLEDATIHAEPTEQEVDEGKARVLMLDFVKAYDRLEHKFLWQTLQKMGFSDRSIKLIKGLAQGGLAKIHINEDFSLELPIQRGVRQGCPLAPYLFTLTTQVLMDAIQQEVENKRIKGLQVGEEKQLVHRLFADDTGICLLEDEDVFRTARETITEFEVASGAMLNLQKSIIIPMGTEDPPAWLRDTGCTVAALGERFNYLGLLSGTNVGAEEYTEHVKKKYEKRLKHWSLRLLSWPDRLIIISSILRALPGYTLLSLGLTKSGVKELDKISRLFLWGWADDGKAKQSLMAWDVFGKTKKEGGLGWGSLQSLAESHMMRNLLQIFRQEQDIWTEILSNIITTRVRTSQKIRERKGWNAQEALLCLNTLKNTGSELSDRMLQCWHRLRRSLKWRGGTATYPEDLTPQRWQAVMTIYLRWEPQEIQTIMRLMKRGGIKNGKDTNNGDGQRISLEALLAMKGAYLTTEETEVVEKFDRAFSPSLARPIKLQDSNRWSWERDQTANPNIWNPPTKHLRSMLETVKPERKNFASRWNVTESASIGADRWRLLWTAKVMPRTKVRMWRFLRRAYFTNGRAVKMNKGDGLCKRCQTENESYTHAMWGCNKLKNRRTWWTRTIGSGSTTTNDGKNSNEMLEAMDWGLSRAGQNPAYLLLVLAIIQHNWGERNEKQFTGMVSWIPPGRIIAEVQRELQVIRTEKGGNDDWKENVQATANSINEWKDMLDRGRRQELNSLRNQEKENMEDEDETNPPPPTG
ncbi:hypothetical protein R1sor_024230 [Riccia sorocarpa]|uniref:Reverse transcriptase domain-containing protein n=1 Tax=Riccia sorocarpa TaxID=122646 RepID=A0ABD3GVY4_9MARC